MYSRQQTEFGIPSIIFFKICSKTVNLPVLYAKSHKTPPNINTYCPLTASFPLTKAQLNLTWKML